MKQKMWMWIGIAALSFSTTALARSAGTQQTKPALDGELMYKNHCTRCHETIRTYSPRSMRTMVTHMRVRATLTKPEAQAIFKYLADDQTAGNSTVAVSTPKRGDE